MKGRVVFDSTDGLHYKCHRVSLNHCGSYIDSPDWIKYKRATINPKNNDGKCCPYVAIVALNHENIVKDPQRISKFKPFIDNCNQKEISFPSHKKDWKKFESNTNSIALNVLLAENNKEEIKEAYTSKHNFNGEMITNGNLFCYKFVNVCKNYNYCHKEMPKVGKNILKYNYTQKSIKVPFIIYVDKHT